MIIIDVKHLNALCVQRIINNAYQYIYRYICQNFRKLIEREDAIEFHAYYNHPLRPHLYLCKLSWNATNGTHSREDTQTTHVKSHIVEVVMQHNRATVHAHNRESSWKTSGENSAMSQKVKTSELTVEWIRDAVGVQNESTVGIRRNYLQLPTVHVRRQLNLCAVRQVLLQFFRGKRLKLMKAFSSSNTILL